ncbi:MAG: hypothetical protein JNK30_01030 [Phenylobacterium sp.]|uniref:sensor histidine kinase n=1 Tax=Phenylobacterium sp. TaxID=1871053 RepID=UPI001A574FED|nr:ATP-binding protein [Phenylobacterium sp.]MBL8769938.1 hypothetical protein [Phenylobacterium sp.]
MRRLLAAGLCLGLAASVWAVAAAGGDPVRVAANSLIAATLLAALVWTTRSGVRSINILAPAVCITASLSFVPGAWSALMLNDSPQEMASITRWPLVFFMINAMCLRPRGARLLSGATTLGILAAAAAWLARPGAFEPGTSDTKVVTMTFFVLPAGLLAQEVAFVVREWQAGAQAAARQARRERRRRAALNAELRRTREDLLAQNRAAVVDTMASAVAHEISQPLGAVVSFARSTRNWLAADPPNLPRARAAADQLHDEALRAARVVEDLRVFANRRVIELVEAPVDELVRGVARLVADDCAARGVALAVEVAPDAGVVWGRGAQLQQVLLNLLNSAIGAFDGAPGAEVRVRADRPEPGSVRLRVTDSGPGLAAKRLRRLDGGLLAAGAGGEDLGVAVCRDIVEAHGGSIGVEAGPDGDGVTVRLPAPQPG